MPSQYFTIAKFGGEAAAATRTQLRNWQHARLVDSPNEYSSDQWPAPVRRKIDAFAQEIRCRLHELPVLFAVEFVDHWSSAPSAEFPFVVVYGDEYELYFVDAPLGADAKRLLQNRAKRGQFPEDRFFARAVLDAEPAWAKLVDDSILVILRRVVGSIVTDEEVAASLTSIPSWIRSGD